MAKKTKDKKKSRRALKAYELSYPIHGGVAVKVLVVAATSKKQAYKVADKYMVPPMDAGGSVMLKRLSLKQSPLIMSSIMDKAAFEDRNKLDRFSGSTNPNSGTQDY